jgi:hypothetical protein
MSRSLYTATAYVVASTGYYSGVAIHASPRMARVKAEKRAWDALHAGDAAVGYCSGIAAEGWTLTQYGRTVAEKHLL